MAGAPWEDYAAPAPAPGNVTPWQDYAAPAAAPKYQASKSGIWPLAQDEQGNISFDSDAGILGSLKRAVMLPTQVYRGEVDPTSEEGIKRAFDAATVMSPLPASMRAGERLIPGELKNLVPAKPAPPTGQALYDAADAGYTKARSMGVDYASPAVSEMAAGLQRGLESDGILGNLAPKTFGILGKLQDAPADSVVPLAGLEAARRAFGHAARDFNNPTDQLAATRLVRGLDEFMSQPPSASSVVGPLGPATEAASELAMARGNYAAASRSDQLAGVATEANRQAASSGSGLNLDNAIRQRAKSILNSDKKSAGFSDAEIDALEGVVKGTAGTNTLRFAGNLLGGGGGLGAVVSGGVSGAAGAAAGGPWGFAAGTAAPVAGALAKGLENYLSARSLGKVDDLVRMRSPLYRQMLSDASPDVNLSPSSQALAKALMSYRPVPQDSMQPTMLSPITVDR